jgi:hypothetical protein
MRPSALEIVADDFASAGGHRRAQSVSVNKEAVRLRRFATPTYGHAREGGCSSRTGRIQSAQLLVGCIKSQRFP